MSDWANIDNLSSEELESALNSEIAELNWGWEDAPVEVEKKVEALPDTEIEKDDDLDDDDADDAEEWLSKSEKKIKKLLAQRNEERDAKAKLENRVLELEKQNTNKDFYTQNPWAEAHKEAIEKEMIETPWLSMEKAFKIVATWEIVEENKQSRAWNRQILGTTPWANLSDKKPTDMTTAELNAKVKEMYGKWEISI